MVRGRREKDSREKAARLKFRGAKDPISERGVGCSNPALDKDKHDKRIQTRTKLRSTFSKTNI